MSPAIDRLDGPGPILDPGCPYRPDAIMPARKGDIRTLRLSATRSRDSCLCRATGRDGDVTSGGCLDAVQDPTSSVHMLRYCPRNSGRSGTVGTQVPASGTKVPKSAFSVTAAALGESALTFCFRLDRARRSKATLTAQEAAVMIWRFMPLTWRDALARGARNQHRSAHVPDLARTGGQSHEMYW